MELKFVTPTTLEKIAEVEKKINYNFPEDFRKDIISINEGYPEKNLFMIGNVERVLNNFFSMNEEDYYYIVNEASYSENHIFFATDPFGNLLAFNKLDNAIYFFDHEAMEDEYTKVASSWTEFKDMLYEDTEN